MRREPLQSKVMRSSRTPHPFALVTAILVGCTASNDTPTVSRSALTPISTDVTKPPLPPKTVRVEVRSDGSFAPAVLDILEGDTIEFVGASGPLAPTDTIVQVDPATASASCEGVGVPYVTTHDDPELDNALTGPLRRGEAGIFVRGHEDDDGFYEAPPETACAGLPRLPGEDWFRDPMAERGDGHKLCKKKDGSNNPYILDSSWDHPGVTGAAVRINWRDLYTKISTPPTTTTTATATPETYELRFGKLDHELRQAAKRGKVALLEVHAGEAIPPWLFTDYPSAVSLTGTAIVPRSVVPIQTEDAGSNPDADTRECGFKKTMGSPADPAYRAAFLTMLREVATHIRANTLFFQALGAVKVTGLNFLTGEVRLPNRCEPRTISDHGGTRICPCNTRTWASPLGAPMPGGGYGGGYTHDAARTFLNLVENTIYTELGKRKSMAFMLIQNGLPKVFDATHFDEPIPVPPNVGYRLPASATTGSEIAYDQQTLDALTAGRNGDFRRVSGAGAPLAADAEEPFASSLFVAMHNGLTGPTPTTDKDMECMGFRTLVPCGDKVCAPMNEPRDVTVEPRAIKASEPGYCPNPWAVAEGQRGQLIGFQNEKSVDSLESVDRSLWNATTNSNAVFVELYEQRIWEAGKDAYAPLSTASEPAMHKSLVDWDRELHARRRAVAGFRSSAGNPNLADPFPDVYRFRFAKPLAPGSFESYTFVNPARRCGVDSRAVGRIRVYARP